MRFYSTDQVWTWVRLDLGLEVQSVFVCVIVLSGIPSGLLGHHILHQVASVSASFNGHVQNPTHPMSQGVWVSESR